jgi:flagellar biosynthesis protein
MDEQIKNKKASALKYDKAQDEAPKVVAHGQRYMAQEIIKIAQKHDIPIKKDEDMVELLSQIEINQEIPPNMYKAVAEVFSFVYQISNDKRDSELNENKN